MFRTNWKTDGAKLTPAEVKAAELLAEIYSRRMQANVNAQIRGELPPKLDTLFSEVDCLDLVTKAMAEAFHEGGRRAISIANDHSDAAKAGSKERKQAEAIANEIRLAVAYETYR